MNEKNQIDTNSPKMSKQEKSPKRVIGQKFKILILVSLIILILLILIISVFLISDRAECPETCDDSNKCTNDACSEKTEFKCAYEKITPCDGNKICEMGENEISEDCPNCDDTDECTIDSYNHQGQECTHEKITPCDGNGICEMGEMEENKISADCPNCNDDDQCTVDFYNYQNQKCENKAVILPPNIDTDNSKYMLYANYFADNLINGNKEILKCFFEPKLSDEEISQFVNLTKDFTEYSITTTSSNASLSKIQYKVLDPDFKSHDIFIYMRKKGEHWYIAKIEDNEGILQMKEQSNQCNIKNPDPDGYLLKICNYLIKNKETIYPNKAPDDYSIKKIEDGTYLETGFSHDVLIVRLDCCGTGDLAYINKNTKEVIGFSPGDE